jgi:hypothetical protein
MLQFTKVDKGEIEEKGCKIDMIIKEFNKHCNLRKNETVERLI